MAHASWPGDEPAAAVRLLLAEAALGQHDAPWLAAFLAGDAGESGNATSGAAAGPGAAGASGTQGTGGGDGTEEDDDGTDAALDALAAVCRSAGWWWPFARVAVVCERPVALRRDEAGRLDCATGPALGFADGLALYAWRGMPVPAGFLDELSSLTPERIRAEENAELRRVMLEHYGYDRYLTDSGARPVHRDGTGVLWRVELPGDEPVVMVEVVNATPEPDGTRRTYWLRVPPYTRTAREGVAWTFGLTAKEYHPVRET
jgi:hypothetical protein